jgi:hypothetical protein
MGIGDLWDKMVNKVNDKLEEKKKKKQEEEQLQKEIMEEMREEIKEIKKEEIRKKMLEEAAKPKKNFFEKLGEEFKGSNIGSNEKVDRMLGRDTRNQGGQVSGRVPEFQDVNQKIIGSQRIPQGRSPFDQTANSVFNKDYGAMMGGGGGPSPDKLKEMSALPKKNDKKKL